jgi:amino acid transporter
MSERFDRATGIFFFVAIMGTGIALGGALAHLFEMPNKLGMDRADYLVTQGAYRGWALLAIVLVVQAIGLIGLAVRTRRWFASFLPTCTALAALIGAQVVFWIYTYPANTATDQWTMLPDNWQALRVQWEYSHAVGAVLQLAAFACLCYIGARALSAHAPDGRQ